jgi:hypothetical protein
MPEMEPNFSNAILNLDKQYVRSRNWVVSVSRDVSVCIDVLLYVSGRAYLKGVKPLAQ